MLYFGFQCVITEVWDPLSTACQMKTFDDTLLGRDTGDKQTLLITCSYPFPIF